MKLVLLPSNIGSFATIANPLKGKNHQEATLVPIQSRYGHSLWWLCCLMGASIHPTYSWRGYKILLDIRDVLTIIHVYNFRARKIQSRRSTPTPPVSLWLRQEIYRRKCPPMDTIKRFQHNCRSCWTPIFECMSRTNMAYFHPNSESIHYREASRTRILIPCGIDGNYQVITLFST